MFLEFSACLSLSLTADDMTLAFADVEVDIVDDQIADDSKQVAGNTASADGARIFVIVVGVRAAAVCSVTI